MIAWPGSLRVVAMAAILALAAPTLFAPRPARAAARDDDEDAAKRRARKHFQKAEKLFALGRFEEALKEYQAAFEEFPAPEFLFNIGQCQRNLGAYDEAIFSFKKYLKLRPDAENRDAVEQYIDELEQERKKASGKKHIETPPPPPPRPAGKPIYKKWWFWAGTAAVVGGVTAIVVVETQPGVPSTDLGNIDFHK